MCFFSDSIRAKNKLRTMDDFILKLIKEGGSQNLIFI